MPVAAEISQKWWSKTKNKTLKSTGLGKQLGAYEKLISEVESPKNPEGLESAYTNSNKLISELMPKTVQAGLKAANKKLHKESIEALEDYKKKLFPAEAKRLTLIYLQNKKKMEVVSAAEGKKLNEEVSKCLNAANAAQTKMLNAMGGVDKARQVAMKAQKTKDEKTLKAAGEIATKGIKEAEAQYLNLQKLLKRAKESFGKLSGSAKGAAKDSAIEGIRKSTELLHDKIESIVDEMGYELKDTLKAENELLEIIEGNFDEVKTLESTINHICQRFSMSHRGLQGTVNQLGGPLEKVKFDMMNAKEREGEEAEKQVARDSIKIVKAIGDKIKETDGLIKSAVKELRDDIKDLPANSAKIPALKSAFERVEHIKDKADSVSKDVGKVDGDFQKLSKKIVTLLRA
ncbi:MAG: hypothetical protein AAF557_24850 [Pseudomonadota bacterium]